MNKIIFPMMLVVLAMMLLLSFNAYACDEERLTVNLASHHFSEEDYNEKNYGLGITCKKDYMIYSGGAYRNSFEEVSAYASVGVEAMDERFGAAISLMAVGGYEDHVEDAKPVSLVPLPEFIYRYKKHSLRVGYVPSVGESDGVATLRYEYLLPIKKGSTKYMFTPGW